LRRGSATGYLRRRQRPLMFGFAGSLEPLVNLLFLAITGFIAWHGIRYRDPDGDSDFVHLLFGCIAAVFFFLVLFQDVLGIARF
jgi:ABC-type Co2+ transport system permease subunit